MHPLFALSLSCLFFGVSFAFDCNGCVSVDEHSFEKLLDKFDVVLLKFDKTYSFKDVHSTFSKVADAAVDNDNILFGLVDIKHFGTQDNMEFAKSQGVTADDVPLLKLYVKGAEKPFVYPKDGPWSISNIKEFINSNSNAYVTKRGRLEVFDKLAKEFITTKDREAVLKKAEEEAAKLTKEVNSKQKSTKPGADQTRSDQRMQDADDKEIHGNLEHSMTVSVLIRKDPSTKMV
ncbi:hypothetical protein NQ315_010915 [Exocentrus adspersus]|uniref:ERp29 N-terminal domain-containing protein n=1 Tax=Exocentrus adspersus TaxID=1586481 RepID=A0AAV8VPL7_9CUCU|nr:hypothetical protein NQ315_010915 [Exocentrus adspersus]